MATYHRPWGHKKDTCCFCTRVLDADNSRRLSHALYASGNVYEAVSAFDNSFKSHDRALKSTVQHKRKKTFIELALERAMVSALPT